ncbi:hypothetical protein [Haloarchaeobius sp. TZWWS8]|uniref:hypothetical protein n=1 Tax=Haloarchaeobius sp. TZWWS8 TaxID=3446121 RepID=UPI003EC0EE4B
MGTRRATPSATPSEQTADESGEHDDTGRRDDTCGNGDAGGNDDTGPWRCPACGKRFESGSACRAHLRHEGLVD